MVKSIIDFMNEDEKNLDLGVMLASHVMVKSHLKI
jgi:hypothetical protein